MSHRLRLGKSMKYSIALAAVVLIAALLGRVRGRVGWDSTSTPAPNTMRAHIGNIFISSTQNEPIARKAESIFQIANNSSLSGLELTMDIKSCGCTTVEPDAFLIPYGTSKDVKMSIELRNGTERRRESVWFADSKGNRTLQLILEADVYQRVWIHDVSPFIVDPEAGSKVQLNCTICEPIGSQPSEPILQIRESDVTAGAITLLDSRTENDVHTREMLISMTIPPSDMSVDSPQNEQQNFRVTLNAGADSHSRLVYWKYKNTYSITPTRLVFKRHVKSQLFFTVSSEYKTFAITRWEVDSPELSLKAIAQKQPNRHSFSIESLESAVQQSDTPKMSIVRIKLFTDTGDSVTVPVFLAP